MVYFHYLRRLDSVTVCRQMSRGALCTNRAAVTIWRDFREFYKLIRFGVQLSLSLCLWRAGISYCPDEYFMFLVFSELTVYVSLRKHPFLRALRRWDFSRGGTSATQRQKFHTDDANQCLNNKYGSHGVPNINLSHFTSLWSILVKCCVHLLTSSSKTQMLLLEKTIFHKYWLFC